MRNNEAPISFNPYSNKSLDTFVRSLVKNEIKNIQFCIPAIITRVISRQEVMVKPAVNQYNAKWESVEWGEIKVPMHALGVNGVFMSFYPEVGTTGWLIAGDLDPSLFIKNKTSPQNQNTLDRHKYQFGFFLPDLISGYSENIPSELDDCFVIYSGASDSGGVRISINKNGDIDINAKTDLKITAENVSINGSDKVVIDGVSWKEHKHTLGITGADEVVADTSTGVVTTTTDLKTGGIVQ